ASPDMTPLDAAGLVGGASARGGVEAASPGMLLDAAGLAGGAPALSGLVAGTNPDQHAGMSAVDDAVRQFNEAAANIPPWMFAPGGFWGQQQARINYERAQARQDANNWIDQQMQQRMPGGVPRSPEGRRLDLSADPRYGAQFPPAAPAPQINQGLVDQANAAAPGFIHVGKHSGLQPLLPETWETG